MPDDEALRRARRQKRELRRLAEPGIERGGEEIRRGGEEIRRGGEEIRRGGPHDCGGRDRVAADVFQRAIDLGGHLIVAFVAPVGAPSRSRCKPVSGPSSPQTVAAAADAELAELRVVLSQKRMQVAHARQTRMARAAGAAASTRQKKRWSATAKE